MKANKINTTEKKFMLEDKNFIEAVRRTCGSDTPMHTHDYYEMELILSGKAIHTINGKSYEISKGDIYLMFPYNFHLLEIKEPLELINIKFSEQTVNPEILYRLVSADTHIAYRLSPQNYEKTFSLFDLLTDEYQKKQTSYQSFIKNLCECIMISMIRTLNITTPVSSGTKPIYRSLLYINRKFREPVSLKELADEAGLSKNYFSTIFYKTFGIHINEYINNVRLDYAKNLIISTTIPITQIAFNAGFGSFPVFSRAFKSRFKISPSQMRKNY